uniref:Integrase, catalytic region, zinc finger, CCHC-type, peptidase aspartic, catalytic n=1 Tax=Tanacetum cinerariifolium TaxID=118510 RepID=A0A699L0A9_TANCI|nr:hypothetical protein [Tanacetum cinerariifolium]
MKQQPQANSPQLDAGLVVPTFQQGEDPIDCINKAMAFLSYVASRNKRIATTSRGNYAASQSRVVKCYNYLEIDEAPVSQQTIPQNSAFQTKYLDAYDSDYDDISSAKAVLMVNLLSCDLDVLFEVPYSNTYLIDMINQDV